MIWDREVYAMLLVQKLDVQKQTLNTKNTLHSIIPDLTFQSENQNYT